MTNNSLQSTLLKQGGYTSSTALILGGGTTAAPVPTAVANKNFVDFRTKTTATSGDCRGLYLRHQFAGVGGSGEALRAVGQINNVTAATGGTCNGGHISLEVAGASGKVSGSGNALRCTLDFSTAPTTVGGTLAVLLLDSNIAAGPTIPANTAFIRVGDVGTQKIAYLLRLDSPHTSLMNTSFTHPAVSNSTKCLRIVADGTPYYIPLFGSGV